MTSTVRYSLPYKNFQEARHVTAPSHFDIPNSRFCVDFYLPQGTPILASRSGVVTHTESRYNKGSFKKKCLNRCNYIIIGHDDGQESIYVHLAWHSIVVSVGQRVKRGQLIGLSGQTGYASYPHLHFGVYDSDNKNIRPKFYTDLPKKTSYMRYSLDKKCLVIRAKNKSTRKQRNRPHSSERRVEEIG